MKHTEINTAFSIFTAGNSYSSGQMSDLLLVTILVKLQGTDSYYNCSRVLIHPLSWIVFHNQQSKQYRSQDTLWRYLTITNAVLSISMEQCSGTGALFRGDGCKRGQIHSPLTFFPSLLRLNSSEQTEFSNT